MMNKIRTAHLVLPFFILLAQLGVSIPVFATDEAPTSYACCGTDCDKNEDMWTKVRERIGCCECNTARCSNTDFVDPTISHQWVLFQESSTNYTLFAGQRITGIECNKIWMNTQPDYWEFALDAAKTHLPLQYKDKIGLAINSKPKRAHNQLHIHVSCINKDVHAELENPANAPNIADKLDDWKTRTLSLNKHNYHVLILNTPTLIYNTQNLFHLLWEHVLSKQDSEMAKQNLVVAVRKQGGFYILNGTDAAGESLLDETCS